MGHGGENLLWATLGALGTAFLAFLREIVKGRGARDQREADTEKARAEQEQNTSQWLVKTLREERADFYARLDVQQGQMDAHKDQIKDLWTSNLSLVTENNTLKATVEDSQEERDDLRAQLAALTGKVQVVEETMAALPPAGPSTVVVVEAHNGEA